MHITRILPSLVQAAALLASAEPIPKPPSNVALELKAPLVLREATTAPNWTTQAWQTHCNNIDYYGDNNECCKHLSGPTWKNCNSVGWSTISESGVLCYDLTADHDCCDDDSVCDTGLHCSGGKCSQTSTSVTVCRDGCVSYNGLGCEEGTCAHGVENGSNSGATPSGPLASPSPTLGGGMSGTTGGSEPTTSTTAAPEGGGGGGLSTSDKIAIGIGVPVGIFTVLGVVFGSRWLKLC